MSCRRWQGASKYVERHLHVDLRIFSISISGLCSKIGNILCGSIVVIATCIAKTLDNVSDRLPLRFLLWNWLL